MITTKYTSKKLTPLSGRLKKQAKHNEGFTIVELLIVVVVIAILAAIAIVSYNGITKQAKDSARASTLAQWKKKSELYKIEHNITCPENYAFVYGNSILGTSDFCVMKYEAKNVGGVATSQAAGVPWVSISQTSAIVASTTAGGHLITEAEWMTIAADALSVKYNWSGDAVGNGLVYQGHVNQNPDTALAASTDDSDIHNGMTGGFGADSDSNSSRVLYLSSGDAIWDLSGNVYEWTQQAIGAPTLTMNQVGISGVTGWYLWDWTLGSLSLGNLSTASRPGTLASYVNPVSSESLTGITTWDGVRGIGLVEANYSDVGARAFARGGSSYDASYAGILSLSLRNAPSATNAVIGFRVVR